MGKALHLITYDVKGNRKIKLMTKKGFLKLSYDVKGNDLDLTCDVKGNDNDSRKWLTITVKNRSIPKYVITF